MRRLARGLRERLGELVELRAKLGPPVALPLQPLLRRRHLCLRERGHSVAVAAAAARDAVEAAGDQQRDDVDCALEERDLK